MQQKGVVCPQMWMVSSEALDQFLAFRWLLHVLAFDGFYMYSLCASVQTSQLNS